MRSTHYKVLIAVLLVFITNTAIAQFESNNTEQDNSEPDKNEEQMASEQIMGFISTWAGAWQSKLADPYIAHYALDYVPTNFQSRDEWLADRRNKLTEPDYIKIRLLDFELIELSENSATTRFTLIYERPGYKDQTYKELVLINNDGFWLIAQEANIEVKTL